MESDKIIFLDDEKKKIMEGNFEIISTHMISNDVWTWGWANPSFQNKKTRIVKDILNYGLTLDNKKNYFLKAELTNSRFVISDPLQIDIHLAIASSLSKIKYIYPLVMNTKGKQEIIYLDKEEYPEDQYGLKIIKDIDSDDLTIIYIFIWDTVIF